MSIQNLYDGALHLCRALRVFEDVQMHIEVSDDMAAYARLIATERPEQPLGAPFDPALQDLDGGKAYFISGRNPQGELVHTQALRLLDLGDGSVADYLRRNFHDFPPPGVPIDLANSAYNAGPGARRMKGRVVYHGEIWIKDNPAWRGRGVIDHLSRFALLTASMHWQPDYVFGFIARGKARKGLTERLCYMHYDPYALAWSLEGRNQPITGNLAWMANDDIRYMMDVPLDEVSAA